jgi:hypothetical protein
MRDEEVGEKRRRGSCFVLLLSNDSVSLLNDTYPPPLSHRSSLKPKPALPVSQRGAFEGKEERRERTALYFVHHRSHHSAKPASSFKLRPPPKEREAKARRRLGEELLKLSGLVEGLEVGVACEVKRCQSAGRKRRERGWGGEGTGER